MNFQDYSPITILKKMSNNSNEPNNLSNDEIQLDESDFVYRNEDSQSRGPNWVFTIHKEVQGQYATQARHWSPRETFEPKDDHLKGVACQLEKCPRTGKIHYQGYIQFNNTVRFSAVKKFLKAPWCWIQLAKKSPENNYAYVTKKNSRVEGAEPYILGEFRLNKNKGKRNDLLNVMDDIKSGKDIVQIALNNPVSFLRYTNNIRQVHSLITSQSAQSEYRDIMVEVLIGPPGVGKSHYAREKYGRTNVYSLSFDSSSSTIWWDNYKGQSVILLDDFYGSGMQWSQLLKVLDKYPLQLQVKGSSTWAMYTKVIITSNRDWYTWYPMQLKGPQWKNQIGALYRRFSRILHMKARDRILIEQIGKTPTGEPLIPTYVGEARDSMDEHGKFAEDYVPNLRFLGVTEYDIPPDWTPPVEQVVTNAQAPVDIPTQVVDDDEIRDSQISDAETINSESQSESEEEEENEDDRDFIVMDSDDESELSNSSSLIYRTPKRRRLEIHDDDE